MVAAVVHIPAQLAKFTGGARRVEVPGRTLREVIDGLEQVYPGIRAQLLDGDGGDGGDAIRKGLAAAVDNVIGTEGLRQPVGAESEVLFLPSLRGG